ncbi:hypothetical protein B0H14DRAFT_3458361 [Mycena olivaceomarginata]|nr:hypothetical protein B0H14DRAFT_3458361 [Mycena olivaceomarginata]
MLQPHVPQPRPLFCTTKWRSSYTAAQGPQALANDVGVSVQRTPKWLSSQTKLYLLGPGNVASGFHRAEDADNSVLNPATLESRVRRAGHDFINEAIFFIDEQAIWTV